ncbi:hypothetical protein [uncultured Tenacibaculum sp.]|uniref:hypothetical protein n=1 Tax=uncultured Tenacibaculum sp. TaxID=174713 RepID=UPI00261BDA60|nr:hypothetical protein [uncultured Tenacibaculum sp.]
MQKLLLYLILLFSILSYSQNKRIEISGTLSDSAGKVVDAHIINVTSKQGTFSDEDGNFVIPVKLGDELKITSIQHKEENLIVANVIIKNKRLDLTLFLKDYLLEEVEVKKTYLSGHLGTDSKGIKKSDKQAVMENLGFNPFPKKLSRIEREIKTAYAGGMQFGLATTVSLDYIINSASGRIDMLEQQKELLDNESRLQELKATYKNYIINNLKIDSTQLSRFLYFSHFDNEFKIVYKKGGVELIEFLKKQAQLFKALQEKK